MIIQKLSKNCLSILYLHILDLQSWHPVPLKILSQCSLEVNSGLNPQDLTLNIILCGCKNTQIWALDKVSNQADFQKTLQNIDIKNVFYTLFPFLPFVIDAAWQLNFPRLFKPLLTLFCLWLYIYQLYTIFFVPVHPKQDFKKQRLSAPKTSLMRDLKNFWWRT